MKARIFLMIGVFLAPAAWATHSVDGVPALVVDTFTGSGSIESHTPDTDTPGNGWTIVDVYSQASAGAATIQGNQLSIDAAQTGVITDLGQADGVVEVDHTPTSTANVSIVLRYVDASNWYKAQFITNAGVIRIQKRVAGITTNYQTTSYPMSASTTYTLRAWAIGDDLGFAVDGVTQITVTDSALNSATKFGVGQDASSAAQVFDDLSIWPAFAPDVESLVISGAVFTITTDVALDVGSGGNGGYSLTCSGGAVTPTYSSGDGTASQVYSLSRTVGASETCTADYTNPGDGWETADGYDLQDFSGASVTTGSIVTYAPCNVGGVTYYYAAGECPASVGAVSVILDGTDVIASAPVDRGDGTLGWYASASSEPPACEVIIAGTDAIDHSTTAVNAAGQLWNKTLTSITAGDRYIHVGHQRNGRPHCDIETSEMITVPGSPGSADEVDFNPGHYLLGYNDRTTFPGIYSQPNIQGAIVTRFWGVVHTGPSTFDWTSTQTALDNLQANGKRGIVFIRDKQFSKEATAAGNKCAPPQLFTAGLVAQFQAGSGTYKCLPHKWKTAAMTENIAMWEDFADNFADHPALEGIILGEESALGLTSAEEAASDFDPDDYLTELKRRNTEVRAMLPNHVLIQNVNWFRDDPVWMESLISQGANLGIGLTGSDPQPTLGNSFYRQYNDLIPVTVQGQRMALEWPHQYGDPCDPDIVYRAMLLDELNWWNGAPGWDGIHYMFWPDHFTTSQGCYWSQILSTIATRVAGGDDVIQTCPANLTCAE